MCDKKLVITLFHGVIMPWSCPRCTLQNQDSTNVCAICSFATKRKNVWSCEKCTFENPNTVRQCNVCGTPRNDKKTREKKVSCTHCGATILWPQGLKRVRCGGCSQVLSNDTLTRRDHHTVSRKSIPLIDIIGKKPSNHPLLLKMTVADGPDMYTHETFMPLSRVRHLVERVISSRRDDLDSSSSSSSLSSSVLPPKQRRLDQKTTISDSDNQPSQQQQPSPQPIPIENAFNDPDVGLPADKDRTISFAERIRRADRKQQVGPRQRPTVEKINLKNRTKRIQDAGGQRVHRPATRRTAKLDGFEKSIYIDPKRRLDKVISSNKDNNKKMTTPEMRVPDKEAYLLFETASVARRIRNTHKTGGERFKEMDYFVASVETPTLRIQRVDVGKIIKKELNDRGKIVRVEISDEFVMYVFFF